MSPTKLRNRAFAVAAADPQGALAIAHSIDDPWFRCQALAAAAEHTRDDNARRRILADAFRAANATREPNRIVSVSAWPLRVLYNVGDWRTVSAEIDRLLTVISQEPHPTRRNDALYWIWHLIRPQQVSAPFARVLDAFREACMAGHGWKRDRNLQSMAVYLRDILPQESTALAALIERPRIRRQTERMLDLGTSRRHQLHDESSARQK